MAKIRTFARIKPSDDLYDDFDTTRNKLYMRIPDSYSRDSTLYNRTRAPIVNHEFKYTQVFGVHSTQPEIYDIAAKNILDGFLEGYNGTIFAYGQTSSGKTHTMQGDLADPDKRGLAPRGISQIFEAVTARKEAGESITVHISFLEIYQEVGYDLLKVVSKNGPGPTTFPKVTVVDGPQGAAIVKNLSFHAVNTEEAAQALLAQGEHNRKVAETAMNNRSSRSHAVFTVYLSSRKGDLVVRSKMHFVDLAGSERVCKTGVKGLQLSEAKYINLSLHYLEGVIIALHQDAVSSNRIHAQTAPPGVSKSWANSPLSKRPYSAADLSGKPRHIPYRNSLLTMLLKDSLGGNCLTAMIATVSLELRNLSESISTCRFAQRVSCISNAARKNEEVDDKAMIKRLRTRVAELEAENNLLKHGQTPTLPEESPETLTQEDRELCKHVVTDFLSGRLMDPVVAGVTDPFKFRECMSILKKLIKEYNEKSIRLAEKLKNQPSHIQEAYFTGGRYHEAPLARPSRRQEVSFRDDANRLVKSAYSDQSHKKMSIGIKPTVLKPSISVMGKATAKQDDEDELDNWQLQIQMADGLGRQPLRQSSTPNFSQKRQNFVKPSSASPSFNKTRGPYEKKKIQEVETLNNKVEAKLSQQVEESSHLKAFKRSVVEQELEIGYENLLRKMEIARHQLTSQANYVKKLEKSQANDDLLEQEQLVEKQLSKRVTRLSSELEEINEKLSRVRAMADPSDLQHVKRSLVEKFGDVTKRDGSIDTNKVKNSLQQQQKLQQQFQKQIEKQRILVLDKQMELMEQNTRQKLEEFKRKLAESQQKEVLLTEQSKPQSIPNTNHTQSSNHGPEVHDKKKDKLSAKTNDSESRNKTWANITGPTTHHQTEHKTQVTPHHASPKEKFGPEQDQPISRHERSHSIQNILNKYRTHTDPREIEKSKERSSRVDEILARYRDEKSVKVAEGTKQQSSFAAANKDTVAAIQSNPSLYDKYARQSSGKAKPDEYDIITVPNSAMVFRATRINSGENKQKDQNKESQNRKYGLYDKHITRDFESTLKSMLETKHGHSKKRTDAWSQVNGNRQHNGTDKESVKANVQQFLTKQYKKKKEQVTQQNQSSYYDRLRAGIRKDWKTVSDYPSQNRPNSKQRNKTESKISAAGQRSKSASITPETKEYSHRMSHYQTTRVPFQHKKDHERLADEVHYSRKSDASNTLAEDTAEDDVTKKKEEEPTRNNNESFNKQDMLVNHSPNLLGGLSKLSQRHEHMNKIREAQNAAVKIQKAWKKHKRQKA